MGTGNSKIEIDEPKLQTPEARQVTYEPPVPYGPINYIFWIDYNIDSEENEEYLIKMNYEFGPIQKMKEEQKLFKKIKELKFEIYIIIMSGQSFSNYIDYLTNNSVYGIPISIIFTRDKKSLENNMEEKYKRYLEDKFYNPLGIVMTIDDLIVKIKTFMTNYNDEINKMTLGYTLPPKDYKDCYTFEYVDNDNKLIFPYLYIKIMKNSAINNKEIKETNKYILENYGKNEEIKNLIMLLLMVENVPLNILAKIWSRIYTIESAFYRNLNADLMKLNNKDYNPYIQVLYSGLKEFEYNENTTLYRGTNISEEEIEKIF